MVASTGWRKAQKTPLLSRRLATSHTAPRRCCHSSGDWIASTELLRRRTSALNGNRRWRTGAPAACSTRRRIPGGFGSAAVAAVSPLHRRAPVRRSADVRSLHPACKSDRPTPLCCTYKSSWRRGPRRRSRLGPPSRSPGGDRQSLEPPCCQKANHSAAGSRAPHLNRRTWSPRREGPRRMGSSPTRVCTPMVRRRGNRLRKAGADG